MITALFMGWTDPVSKKWFPIRKLTWNSIEYQTSYVNGVFEAIETSQNMKLLFDKKLIKPDQIETSKKIPHIYAQRMPIIRPEDMLKEAEFFNLSKHSPDPITFTSRSGGYSVTDGYDIFPEVTPDQHRNYEFYFLPRNLARLETSIHQYIDTLSIDTVLEFDRNGYLDHKNNILGKLPGYLTDLISNDKIMEIKIAKINSQTSYRYNHLLCCATFKTQPFTESKYQVSTSILVK